jgi:hypothetical protein
MPSPFAYQQQFQNAGQYGSFSYTYNNIGNSAWVYPVLIMAFVILIAFLRSEARYRTLLEQMALREGARRSHYRYPPRKMVRRE